jgi:outer membrane receptor protein involved in Fe transport
MLLSFVLLSAVVAGVAMAQTTGKIRGTVIDRETGEPLVGANVTIEATTLGAACDVNGEFIVLSVPPGTYSLRATYVGYRTMTIRNVNVTGGLTTEANFSLESEAIPGPAIEIIAEPPLINKNATNTISLIRAEQIEQLPVRNVANIFTLAPGVIQQGGNFYVRGGRSEETAYFVDGVLVNNPMNGALQLNVINNAIEEVQTQIGGMTAQYGNAMSAVVSTTTKTGGPQYKFMFEVITDELGGTESKNFLGAYSYGLNEYVITASGPVIPGNDNIRFFLAGQRVFNRTNPTFLDGINFVPIDSTDIVNADWEIVDRNASSGSIQTVPTGTTGNRAYLADLINQSNYSGGRNYGGYALDLWGLQGNIFMDFGSINVKLGGTYSTNSNITPFGRTLNIISVTAGNPRGMLTESRDWTVYGKWTHIINPTTFYTVQVNGYEYFSETMDQRLGNNVEEWGNPNNPENGNLVGPSRNPPQFNLWSFNVNWPGNVPLTYTKIKRSNLGGRVDFTKQFGRAWEFIVGGEFTRYTIRSYGVRARNLYGQRQTLSNATDWEIYAPQMVYSQNFGYDIYGNEFDGGSFTDNQGTTVNLSNEGPKNPLYAGFYIQNKFEFSDLVINFGLRYDIIDPGSKQYEDPTRILIDDLAGVRVISDSSLVNQEVATQLSPRIGFSFPVTDRTVFHATYGQFLQQGRLFDLYDGRLSAAFFLTGTFHRASPSPNLKPERTTDYEVGFRQQIGEVASFDLTFFYKDIKDLHVLRKVFPQPGSETKAWNATVNGDYGTSKGVTLTFQMRRTARIALFGNYTLSNSTATGSASRSHNNIAWQDNSFNGRPYFPVIPQRTDFDQQHVGNINLDYRFGRDDGGPILERLGLNLLFRFSSGIPWTLSQITGAFNFSATNAPEANEARNASDGPWQYTLDLRLDKTVTLFNSVDLNVYLWVTNVFNRQNVIGVYSGTGEQNNDGWFTTSQGQTWLQNNGQQAVTTYNYLQNNLAFLDPPRVVRLGLRLDI